MAGFTLIDNNLLENKNLSLQEQSLLIALVSYHNEEKGYSYPNYEQIKLRSKLKDNRTLIKAMDSLIEKGYLTKETLTGIGVKYFITKCNITPSGELHHVENSTTCKDTLPPSGELHEDVVENYTTTNTNTNTNTNTKANTNKKTDKIKSNFSKIISLYPGKKIKCVRDKKLPKLIEKYGEEQLIRCVKRYADECNGKDRQYILNESTFWNGRYMEYLDSVVSENSVAPGSERCVPNFKFIDI